MIIDDLNKDGIAIVPQMARYQVLAFRHYLEDKPQYDGHTMGEHIPARPNSTATSYDIKDIIMAPYYFEYALSHTNIAEEFLGAEPVLYSINCFTTYPNTKPDKYAHKMHIDYDDDKLLVLSTFITDVLCNEDGAHSFHQYDEAIRIIYGHAGTSFLEDTSQMHGGVQPTRYNRILAWCRWCIRTDPRTYHPDGLYAIDKSLIGDRYPTDERLQRIIRMVVK